MAFVAVPNFDINYFLCFCFLFPLFNFVGNPVTGEGYSAEAAEKKEETPRRGRVPPGGFSSKLW
jgi:hypothetical protein